MNDLGRLSRRRLGRIAAGGLVGVMLGASTSRQALAQDDGGPPLKLGWNRDRLQVERAWAISRGSTGVPVAVIDSGMDTSHSEFAGRVGSERDYTGSNGLKPHYHGTFVGGIVGGESVGVAPKATLHSFRVFDQQLRFFGIAQAIRDATNQGIKIINMSLGGPLEDQTMREALDYAADKGVLIICAAGNSGRSQVPGQVGYPAAHKRAFAVASTTYDGRAAYYSSTGSYIRVAAPGGDSTSAYDNDPKYQINGPTPGGGYQGSQGTSFAAPHVAGVASLMWAANPGLSADEIKEILMRTATPLGGRSRPNETYGWGEIDAWRAVRAALGRDLEIRMTTKPETVSRSGATTVEGWVFDRKNPRQPIGDLIEAIEVFANGQKPDGLALGQATLNTPVVEAPETAVGFKMEIDPATLPGAAPTLWFGARTMLEDAAWCSFAWPASG